MTTNIITIADLASKYLQAARRRLRERTFYETVRLIHRDIIPAIGSRSVVGLKRGEVIDLHERIAERAPVVANRAIGALSRLLAWAMDHDMVMVNVARRIRLHREEPREVIASIDELSRIYRALPDDPAGWAIAFIMVTGCRRSEALNLRWEHVDLVDRTWTKPSALSKSRRSATIPLSAGALACLPAATSLWVFSTTHDTLRRTWERVRAGAGLEALHTHDLRRTHLLPALSREVYHQPSQPPQWGPATRRPS
jgi:integrase